MGFCLVCGKKHENKSNYCSMECEELDREYNRVIKEIQKRENFINKVDERDIDPVHSLEQQRAEDEKYERCIEELVGLKEQSKKIRISFKDGKFLL